jgi:type I restriction enzyme R subunit
VLRDQLRRLNHFNYKGRSYPFGDAAIESAIDAVTSGSDDGLIPTNQRIYDLLTLGKSFEQIVDGSSLSPQLRFFDWGNPENNVSGKRVELYREDLKFFENLRRYVRQLFSQDLDYKEYEAQMQKLIDRHVGSADVVQLTELVDIFNKEKFEAELEKLASPAARADTIAHRTSKTITERMDEDPVFYQRLSRLLEKLIEGYRVARLKAASDVAKLQKAAESYLKKARELSDEARSHGVDRVPKLLRDRSAAIAFFNALCEALNIGATDDDQTRNWLGSLADRLDNVVKSNVVVDWQSKPDIQNAIKNALEDVLLEAFEQASRDVSMDSLDSILNHVMQAARRHYAK